MSEANASIVNPDADHAGNEALRQGQIATIAHHKNYKGFVAGIFSGVAKLSGTLYHLPSRQ